MHYMDVFDAALDPILEEWGFVDLDEALTYFVEGQEYRAREQFRQEVLAAVRNELALLDFNEMIAMVNGLLRPAERGDAAHALIDPIVKRIDEIYL